MPLMSDRHYGIVLVTVSAVFWSTAGFFVRLADLDAWTVLGWRSLFAALFLSVMAGVQNGRNVGRSVKALGRPGLFSIAVSVVSMISYVFALKLTTVANVMTMYATLPFIATAVAFFWVGERITLQVAIASAVSLIGIVIMAGAATNVHDIAGIAAAFLMTLGFGTQLVHTRLSPGLDMTVVSAVSAALCGVLSWPLMAVAVPTVGQLGTLAMFGILTTGIAYVLVLQGSRYISSGEAGFLSLLDVVLGPLWVWLFFAERPTQAVLIGGGIVLASVIWYLAQGLKAPAEPRRLNAA